MASVPAAPVGDNQRVGMLEAAMDLMKALQRSYEAVDTPPQPASIPTVHPRVQGESTPENVAYVASLEKELQVLKGRVQELEAELERGATGGARARSRPQKTQLAHKNARDFLNSHGIDSNEFLDLLDREDEEEADDSTAIRTTGTRSISAGHRNSYEGSLRDAMPVAWADDGEKADASSGPAKAAVTPPSAAGNKTPIQVVVCTDEVCEILEPADCAISTVHQDSAVVKFKWKARHKPQSVLIVKKRNDALATEWLMKIAHWLSTTHSMCVYVEPSVRRELCFSEAATSNVSSLREMLQTYSEEDRMGGGLEKNIDFIVSLGGDGTVLWCGKLFNGPVPPVLSFALGSLGFLTPFDPAEYVEVLEKFITRGAFISMRTRIAVRIERQGDKPQKSGGNIDYHALNEVVIDRGPSSVLSNLLAYYNDKLLTRVQADGLIVGTPTGSTAYSLSAGGAIVHPAVPSLLLTPICPHSLSFRPLILPDSATLRVELPADSRATAWVAMDGRDRVELERGDRLVLWISPHPVPAVTKLGERGDWLTSLVEALNWNVRREQKPL